MKKIEKSRRSRRTILDSALELFSQQGYRATTVRDIAEKGGLSTGSLYHQFPDKEAIFQALLDEYWTAISQADYPVNRALAEGAFPDRLEDLGRASRDAIERYRPYVALIYVDVVEMEGVHIKKFYSDMAQRFGAFIEGHGDQLGLTEKLRDDVSPVSAMMLATRTFMHFFAVELLFGVPNHFGKDNETVIHEIADILRHGMLRSVDAK